MTVHRSDRGELSKAQRLDNGWLRAPARLTRTGVFVYRNPDGTERRELRLPGEVFNADSLASFSMVPVTDGHPAVPLDSNNTRDLQRGHVGENVRRDGDFVAASMLVTDESLVSKLLNKEKVQVSCGYSCDLEETPGVYEGERYDAIQRNIRGNHVAIVDLGRAGPEVRVHVDRVDGVLVSPSQETVTTAEEPGGTVKIRIDGVEYEGTEQLAQAFAKMEAKHADALEAKSKEHADALTAKDSALKTATTELEKVKARADSLEADLKKAQQAHKDATDPAKLQEIIRSRVALEKSASEVLGSDVKLDGKSEAEIKLEMLKKLEPELKLDGKSAEYIQAALDIAIEKRGTGAEGAEALRKAREATRGDDKTTLVREDEKRAKFLEDQRNLWKKPLTVMKQRAS